jgi:hypothetical protein
MDRPYLPASVLVELYIRLRNEVGSEGRDLDPNHKLRAAIALAIFQAEEKVGADIVRIETRVREMLALACSEPLAA